MHLSVTAAAHIQTTISLLAFAAQEKKKKKLNPLSCDFSKEEKT